MKKLLVALVALLVAGCGGEEGAPPTTGVVATAPTPPTATTGDGIDPLEGASTEPVVAEAAPSEPALLRRVALARHEGFDRVVFEFANALPGYRIEYVEPPLRQDGSGNPVAVEGRAVVQVRFEPASGYDVVADAPSYAGPPRFAGAAYGTSLVREVVRVSDFEAVLVWAIGADDRVDFRILALDGPPRLAVDLRNH
jgi:hypothetical protein